MRIDTVDGCWLPPMMMVMEMSEAVFLTLIQYQILGGYPFTMKSPFQHHHRIAELHHRLPSVARDCFSVQLTESRQFLNIGECQHGNNALAAMFLITGG